MSAPSSPVLRALRRLVARDPETPIRLDVRGARASFLASAGWALRPAVRSMEELLGGDRPAAADAAPSEDRPGALGSALTGVARHRRVAGLSVSMLLLAVAAVGAMPAISAAGEPAPAQSSASAAADTTGVDQAASQAPVYQTADGGDGSIYNVMQAVGGAAPGASGFQVYVVRGGDTLVKIGAKFGLSRLSVYWANQSRLPDPSALRIGQKLIIPPDDGVTVTIKANDTLSAFGSRYRVSTKAIMAANGLTGTSLTVGQLLLIPVTPPPIPTPKPASGGGTVWRGQRLRWPVPASRDVTQYYNARTHPAIDIAAPTGTPVIAAIGGTVIWSGWKYSGGGLGGGIEIWINSGGKLYTTYNHLSRTYVRVGQVVAAGQHIGNVGMTGNATGPHLHFEVWVCYPWSDGTTSCARNPFNYF